MRIRMIVLAAVACIGALFVATAHAATTYHLAAQRLNEDSFDNYDFNSASVSSSNVDWPVGLFFYNNAEVEKIKAGLSQSYFYPGDTQNGRLDNSFGWFFDDDGGRKTRVCSVGNYDDHYRIYADPDHGNRNWTAGVGFYVIGTTHVDGNECGGGTAYFGFSEPAEDRLGSVARSVTNWTVYDDNYAMNNYEAYRAEGNHWWLNNGNATMFRLP